MTSYVDKLSEFGKSFQIKVIYSLIHDIKFLQDIFDIVEPSYFESEEHQWIVEKIIQYYNEYKSCLTMEVLALQVKSIQSTSFQTSVKNSIKEVYTADKLDDIEFIKDQFEDFCKNQKLKKAILASTELIKQGNYEEIKYLVDDALKAGMSKDFGHDQTAPGR
jgi:glucan-binding YG repeat protein